VAGEESSAARNRRVWDAQSDDYQAKHGAQLEASGGTAWGVWQIPESELGVLGDVAGRAILELGCGAAQWSIALAAAGAHVTGLDNSARQLEHACELMAEAGASFPLVHSSAESTPFDDASFDIVFCDYGAMAFADPYVTVPEAARILRDGGLLAFLMNTPILDITWPIEAEHPTESLVGDYFGKHVIDVPGECLEYQLPYGEWIWLFRHSGFAIEDLIEMRPPPDAVSSYRDESVREWARRWPLEHIWRVRREAR
jgi:ubiquinone/menaquinone biosynthesis C-methylase UbiE